MECDLKICDFGLATVKNHKINNDANLSSYVVTRWYRAPELLLKCNPNNYDSKIDMWSVGCVLAEMYLKKALFAERDLNKHILKMV
jgi:serine/threonine protein kinase